MRRDRFLAKINEMTPWPQMHQPSKQFYAKVKGGGNPPIGLTRMLRGYFAQQLWSVRRGNGRCDS